MSRIVCSSLVFCALVAILPATHLNAKPPLQVSFQQLKSSSSLVAIGKCVKATRITNTDFHPTQLAEFLIYFEVATVFKGEDYKRIRLRTHRYLKDVPTIGNGPTFMFFGRKVIAACDKLSIGETIDITPQKDYVLVFLREDDAGIFIPSSGFQYAGMSSFDISGLTEFILDEETAPSIDRERSKVSDTDKEKIKVSGTD